MTAVYDAYVWKCGRLEWTAQNIVAENDQQAALRSVMALKSRPELRQNRTLQALSRHMLGYDECPEGVTVQVVKKIDRPARACVVAG